MVESQPLNPYVAGPALGDPSGRAFFGRDDIFEFVRSALAARQRAPILLYGQRRIGKSSILKQLPNHLPRDLLTVFYDLQGKASMNVGQVLFGLGRAVADRLEIPRPQREETTEETFTDAFFNRVIQALNGHPERLVLLFDEFDIVDERFAGSGVAARRFMGFLGELIERCPSVGYILVVGRKTEELSEEFNSTLLKGAVMKRIGRLSPEQGARLVQEPSQDYLRFSETAVERIYELASGHPLCTQLLCYTIWTRRFADTRLAAPGLVRPSEVEDALEPAVELGTNGLNWIFDGLTSASHRLFLSSLAEVANPVGNERATLSVIEESLRRRRVTIDTVEMRSAPRELERWDIVESNSVGFRFAVPVIGFWIRRERPLDRLESDVRYADPRTYNYYELAVEAHRLALESKESERTAYLDEAIQDYKRALQRNPSFLDAQKGVAAALRDRRADGDMDAAIEAYERVLELDPEGPRGVLVDLLVEVLESGGSSVDRLLTWYDRVQKLDTENRVTGRAQRILGTRAFALLEAAAYRDAERLFRAAGDNASAEAARRRGQVNFAFRTVMFIVALVAGIGGFLATRLNLGFESWTRIFLTALSGTALDRALPTLFLGVLESSQEGSRPSWFLKRALEYSQKDLRPSRLELARGPIALVAGFAAGYLVNRLWPGEFFPYLVAFTTSLGISGAFPVLTWVEKQRG